MRIYQLFVHTQVPVRLEQAGTAPEQWPQGLSIPLGPIAVSELWDDGEVPLAAVLTQTLTKTLTRARARARARARTLTCWRLPP